MSATLPEDLSVFPAEQLRAFVSTASAELARRDAAARLEAEKKILELASAHSISLSALAGSNKGKVGPGKGKPTAYQHPTNTFLQWPGKGPKPAWLKELLAAGTTLESLKVDLTQSAPKT